MRNTSGGEDMREDVERFAHLKNSFNEVGVNDEEQECYFGILAAILNLGNINFIGEDEVSVSLTSSIFLFFCS